MPDLVAAQHGVELSKGTTDGERLFTRFLEDLAARLDDPGANRSQVCCETIRQIYGWGTGAAASSAEPLGVQTLQACFDPRNVTLKAEQFADIDKRRYAAVKPLTWLWIMFDRSPLGQNACLALPFRRLLARRIFARCGKNITIWPFVEFTYGYNISAGDDVVIHRHTYLDDRGGISIGNNVSMSDYVSVYSHSHDINDIKRVSLKPTVIDDHVRLTFHSTVLAGATIGKDAMLGAMALATGSVVASSVSGGVPARLIRNKDRPCPLCEEARSAAARNGLADSGVTHSRESYRLD